MKYRSRVASAENGFTEELKAITQESLVKFAEQYVVPSSTSIRKMSIHIRSRKLLLKELYLRLNGEGMKYLSYKDLEEARAENEEEGTFIGKTSHKTASQY